MGESCFLLEYILSSEEIGVQKSEQIHYNLFITRL